jgi:T5SS/PEP-CTERM-associated repeat protein
MLLLAVNTPARATDFFWQSPGGGAFTDSDFWQPFDPITMIGPGGPGDTVNFDLGVPTASRYTVAEVVGENNRLLVHDDSLTLSLSGGYMLLSNTTSEPSFAVGVAAGDTGDVILTGNGILATEHGSIGSGADTTGTVTVTGAGSNWNNSGELTIGNFGTGTMVIEAGGVVSSLNSGIGIDAGATGEVTVTGAGSNWNNSGVLFVGVSGTGTLTIEAGGSVSNTAGHIGRSGSTGVANVSGPGSTWTNTSELRVGIGGGAGTLTIGDSGQVDVLDDGTGTLALASSTAATGILNIGAVAGDAPLAAGVLNAAAVHGTSDTATLNFNHTDSNYAFENTSGTPIAITGSTTVRHLGSGKTILDGTNIHGPLTPYAGGTTVKRGTLEVTGSISHDNALFLVGENSGDNGAVRITGGGQVTSRFGEVGLNFGSTGHVEVSGPGSTWINVDGAGFDNHLHLGRGGSGSLDINNGGVVNNRDGTLGLFEGTGSAVISGADSIWTISRDLTVGGDGVGVLTIEAGGAVSGLRGFIGWNSSSNGQVTVTGANATLTHSGDLFIGNSGTGTLTIEAGGSVSSPLSAIGVNGGATGEVTVTGAGSNLNNSGELFVGVFGSGTLTIEAGGSVSNAAGTIGHFASSTGVVTVTGSDSTWINGGPLVVANAGQFELRIEDGGRVENIDGFIAAGSGSIGAAIVSGASSTWTMSGQLSIGGSASTGDDGGWGTLLIGPGGTVSVVEDIVVFPNDLMELDGGTLTASTVTFDGGGQFNFLAGTLHVGTFDGDLTNQGGTLAPGDSAGSTTIVGDYTQGATATLDIEIGGDQPGEFDVLTVTGTATLAGELRVADIEPFVPAAGGAFVVLAAADVVGTFESATMPAHYEVLYGPTTVTVQSVAPSADLNQDGVVDLVDFGLFQTCFNGSNQPPSPNCMKGVNADLDQEGDVDLNDFVLFYEAAYGS